MSFSTISTRLFSRRGAQCLSKAHRTHISPLFFTSRPTALKSSRPSDPLRSLFYTSRDRSATAPRAGNESPLGGIANTLGSTSTAKSVGSSWPEMSDKMVGYWLIGSSALVFGIVILGGLTRLTESGLSITEWKPVTGTLPPLSDADWTETFDKYKDSPEYRLLNPNMTLDEFKFIYYMEWGHRIWGRAIGLTFVLPAAYFTLRRRVTPKIARRLLGISALIGFQGLIGWWMVKSGLREDLFAKPGSHPRVSQYRLTTHLGAAFTVYAAMLWSGLDILRDNRLLKNDPQNAVKAFQSLCVSQLRVFRGLAGFIVAMVFTTAMTGGLVAGLDAGLIYNEFPKMGTGYIPPRNELMKPYYSQKPDLSDLWWRNQLENPTMVQFQHRVAAVSTYAAILAVFAYSRFNPAVVAAMPLAAKKTMHTVMALASCQVALGIGTLIYMVPIHLAATHQAGALALLTASIVLTHRISLPKAAARIAARRIQTAPIAFKGI